MPLTNSEMQRQNLIHELTTYQPGDDLEKLARDQIIEFICREAGCFERATVAGHCTASAFIVDAACGATVLVYHRKFQRWVQPGGHADGDGDLRGVALREAVEETRLTSLRPMQNSIYDLHVFDNSTLAPEFRHFHYDFRYIFCADRDELPTVSDESHDVAWIELHKLATIATDESVQRLARKLSTAAHYSSGAS